MTQEAFFEFTEEHAMIRQTARDFAQNEIAPIAAEYDETGEFPLDTIRKMGEMVSGSKYQKNTAAGLDTMSYVLALEEICKADAGHGTIMSVNNSLYVWIDEIWWGCNKKEILIPVASGKAVGAYSRTMSGSDAAPCSRAVKDGDTLQYQWRKSW
jgi:alkylation response protein AidB-like acyl-CoA dehydrogenase